MASQNPEYDPETAVLVLQVQFESDTENYNSPTWLIHIPPYSSEDFKDDATWHDTTTVSDVLNGFPPHWVPVVRQWVASELAQGVVKTHDVIITICNHGAELRVVPQGSPDYVQLTCNTCDVVLSDFVGKKLGLEARPFKRVSISPSFLYRY